MARTTTFKPWAGDFKAGWTALLIAAALFWLAWIRQDVRIGLPAVAVGWFGLLKLRKGYFRWRGKSIESRALRADDLPAGWTFQSGRMMRAGGDIDFYIESPGRQAKFAIEHKTIQGIRVRHRLMGLGEPYFLNAHGGLLRYDPVPQTMRNAAAVGATPVLWLSQGNARTRWLRTGLIIVQGDRDKLLRAIGARGWLG